MRWSRSSRKVFDLIHYLLREPARVVSKDDLLDVIWNGRVVSDSTLTSRINAAAARSATAAVSSG
jgi:DNA-binding winged helix-turn-helix (wHTH) protein